MTNQITDISPRNAARIAGYGYLIIIILAVFAEFFVRSSLVVPGDATATINNIMANEMQFRLGVCSYLIAAIFDVVVAVALYVLLKPVNKSLALLTAWFRLVHATIFAAALNNLFNVLYLLNNADHLITLNSDQLHAQVMFFLNAFSYEWLIGLVFFGLHCFFLGFLILKSTYIPRFVGVLLIVASFGYLIDSFAHFLMSNYADFEAVFLLIVAVPAIIAELALCLWLILKGAHLQQSQTT